MATIEQRRMAEIDRHLRDTQTRLNDDTQLQTERHCLWLMARVRELDAEIDAAAARAKALEAGLAEYGRHKLNQVKRCGYFGDGSDADCDCGLIDLIDGNPPGTMVAALAGEG